MIDDTESPGGQGEQCNGRSSAGWRIRLQQIALSVGAAAAAAGATVASKPGTLAPMPRFSAQRGWLKMPKRWTMGDISAVAVDRHDRIWILQRPRSLSAANRDSAAPPVLMFDSQGRFIRGFGGAAAGYDWPTTEHSLAVDAANHVWIAGSARTPGSSGDDMLLEFTDHGRLIRQIGHRGASGGNRDTNNLHAPGDVFVDDTRHEVYVADGYGNRRVIVFDTRTGGFRRMWGGFGGVPTTEPAPLPRPAVLPAPIKDGEEPEDFNGVHGVEIARDGRVYVSDRNNQRIQVFTRAGRYLAQVSIDPDMPSPVTASGMAFSGDRAQRYLFVADFGNNALVVLDRQRLAVIGRIDRAEDGPALNAPHLLATNGKGVLYVAEVAGRRVQRLTYRTD